MYKGREDNMDIIKFRENKHETISDTEKEIRSESEESEGEY